MERGRNLAAGMKGGGGHHRSPWTLAVWGAAALLLLLPLIAMQLTDEVRWDAADFLLFGLMLAAGCGTWELAARTTGSSAYRAAVAIATASGFLLVWLTLAVGVVGTEAHPANLLVGAVLAVAIIGCLIARFRPDGMSRALVAAALAQMLVAATALVAGTTDPAAKTLALSGCFAAAWLASAWLFRKAARERPHQ